MSYQYFKKLSPSCRSRLNPTYFFINVHQKKFSTIWVNRWLLNNFSLILSIKITLVISQITLLIESYLLLHKSVDCSIGKMCRIRFRYEGTNWQNKRDILAAEEYLELKGTVTQFKIWIFNNNIKILFDDHPPGLQIFSTIKTLLLYSAETQWTTIIIVKKYRYL